VLASTRAIRAGFAASGRARRTQEGRMADKVLIFGKDA
jgi:hypothetical protein